MKWHIPIKGYKIEKIRQRKSKRVREMKQDRPINFVHDHSVSVPFYRMNESGLVPIHWYQWPMILFWGLVWGLGLPVWGLAIYGFVRLFFTD
jgi:hypothetical protein